MFKYQTETVAAVGKVPFRTVSGQSMRLGLDHHEPLLLIFDSLLRYARAYEKRFESKLAYDGFLGDEFAHCLKGVRALLNGDGAVAMERGITTDSKDNGALESLYWTICEVAGFDGDSLLD